jgi:two-component system, cell cycle sensor histidine kinase and response regulator CckA
MHESSSPPRADDGAPEEAAELLREASAMARVGGWSHDPATGRGMWTAEVAHIYEIDAGLPATTELGLSFFHGEHRDKIVAALRDAVDRAQPFDVEVEMVSAKGNRKWVRSLGRPVVKEGNVVQLRGTIQDITAQRMSLLARRGSEARFRLIFEQAAVGICEVDVESRRFLRANQKFCEIVGYPQEEVVGRRSTDFSHPEDLQSDEAMYATLASGVEVRAWREKRYVRKDGAEVWARTTASRSAFEGEDPFFVVVVEDISDRWLAREQLRRSEQRLAAIFDVTLSGTLITRERDGVILDANESFVRQLGWTRSELLGRTVDALGLFEDPADREHVLEELRAHSILPPMHARIRQRSAAVGEFLLTGVLSELGDERCVITSWHDITELRRSDAALAQAEQRHRFALGAADLATWWMDFADNHIVVDERGRQQFGLDSTSLSGTDVSSRIHPEDVAVLRAELARSRMPGEKGKVTMSFRISLPDGETRWIMAHLQVHFDVTGAERRPLWLIATTRDITREKRAEQELRASEERYRSLVDNLDDVIFSMDLRGRIIFANRAHGRFGFRPGEFVGRTLDELAFPEDRARIRHIVEDQLAGGSEGPYEARILDSTRKTRWVRITTHRLVVGGRVAGLTGVVVDLTQQRETEEQLRAAQKMEAVGRLAGGVAHDFNNLLSVILSYAELASMDLRPEDPLRADIEEIAQAAQRAEGLTRQLLAFSRRQVLNPESVDLNELVASLGKMLTRLIGEDVLLEILPGAELYETKADRGQVEQVLMNLVVNARDAMPDGGRVTIVTANVELDPVAASALEVSPGDYVELRVTDTGSGMDEATRARIFEPFFTTKEVGKGTGLGLAMVYGIVRQSGGGIAVDSAPDAGATFRIVLPRIGAGSQPRIPKAPSARVAAATESILVVEDEPALRNVIRRVLESAGYKVRLATSPGEALSFCEEPGVGIDLVLTDVVMPGMSGIQLAERLAKLRPHLKVLFMSGYSEESIERHAIPAHRLLRKPFDRQALTQKVRAALDEV